MANKSQSGSSLRAIAKQVGLSVTAVHQILNNKENKFISTETRNRVWKTANEVGYRPNIGYKLMRGQKTHIVAIIVSSDRLRRQEPFSELLISLVNMLEQQHYMTYLSVLKYSTEENVHKVRELISRGVEHFIAIGNPVGALEIEQEIDQARCSVICLGDMFTRRILHEVNTSQEKIIKFFISKGYQNIRCLVPDIHLHSIHGRMNALKNVFPNKSTQELLDKYHYLYPALNNTQENFEVAEFEAGILFTTKLLEEHPETNAIFYPNDSMALGGIKVLSNKNIVVGKDVLVAGFYNTSAVRQHFLPISSIGYNLPEILQKLMEHAFDNLPCDEEISTIEYIRE